MARVTSTSARCVRLAVSAALLPCAAAFAQETSKDVDRSGLEEVVVTAERREASLQTVPVAVSALTTEALQNRQITEAEDLQRVVPSLRMSNNVTSPTNLSPSLRGSLQQDASLVVAESPFGIYIDDVYVGRLNGNNVTLADIERVEVLRGPQGTLYGRNTLAGAIKFISRTPSADNEWFTATAGVGNYDQYLGSLSWGGGLSGNWAASFAAQANNKDGQFTNRVTGQDRGLERNWAARAKLRYTGSERLDALFSVSYTDSKNDAVQLLPGRTPADPQSTRQYNSNEVQLLFGPETVATPDRAYSPPPITNQPSGKTKQTIVAANLSYAFDAVTFKSITSYVRTDDFFSTDFGGLGLIVGASKPDAKQFAQEFQWQGNALNERLNYIAGLYYLKEDGDQRFGWQFFTPTSTSQISIETKSISAFGQADYKFTDALKVTFGGRWVQDKKDFAAAFQRLPSSIIPGPASDATRLSNKYTEFTPKLGIDYQVSSGTADSLLLYGSVARGFKSGGYNGINIFNLNDAKSSYAPESNWTYELGLKTDLLDRRLRVNAALFLADISDLTLNATVNLGGGALAFPVQNAGDATIKGLEFEVTYQPIDDLKLYASGVISDGEYDRLAPGSAPFNAQLPPNVVNGMNVGGLGVPKASTPQVPDYTATLGFDYGFDLALAGGSRFSIGADLYRTDDYVTAATNDFVIKAYSRFNAHLGLAVGDHWSFRVAAKNVNDKRTINVGSRGLGGYLVLPPREVLFSVTYEQ